MKGHLYRFTPAGGKPNHYTHDHSSAVRAMEHTAGLDELEPGDQLELLDGTVVERIA